MKNLTQSEGDSLRQHAEELEYKIIQLQKEILDLKSKQDLSDTKNYSEHVMLEKILEICPIGISYVDSSGKVVYANKRTEEIFRLSKVKLLEIEATSAAWQVTTLDGKPFPDEDLPFARVKNTKESFFNVEHAIEYDGQKKVISVSASPVFNCTSEFFGMVAIVEDITERKRSEEDQRQAKEYAENLFQTANIMIVGLDADGKVTVLNDAAEKISGYTLADLKGKNWFEVIVPKDQYPLVWKEFTRLLKGGIPRTFENPIRTKSGEERTISWQNNELHELGKITRTISFGYDITERIRAEEKLKYSEHNLAEAERIGNTGSWDYEVATDTASWSANMFRIFDVDPEIPTELIFKHFVENLVYPDDRQFVLSVFADALSGKRPYDLEYRAVKRDGSLIVVHAKAETFRDENGNVIRLIGKVEDITERKQIEERLRESETRLNLFFAQSLDGFFFMMLDEPVVWDNSIDKEKTLDYVFEHHRITKINDAMLKQYGAEENQFIGLTPNDLFSHDIKHGRQVWKDFFDMGQLHVDTTEKKFDGTNMIIEGDYICLYDEQKRITGHFGVQKEVTDIRHAEEILQKSRNELQDFWDSGISADYISSIDGEILKCNPTFMKLFGIEQKHTTEKIDFNKLYKNLDERAEFIREVSAKGKVESYEVDFIKNDGKVINSIVNANGIFDDTGNLIKIRGYIVDITDRKNAEEELKEREEKYRLLFENNPQPMWIYDLETLAFLEVNEAAIKHYGYSLEEFLSMTIKEIRPAEDIPALMKLLERSSSSLNFSDEMRHVKKNGEIIFVEITSFFIITNGRNARHVLINDVTKRKQAQFEYQTMIKTTRDGFWIVDAETGKFLDINQSYCDMIGYSRVELLQMTISDIEAAETHEETRQHIKLIKEKGFDSFESKHKTKFGTIIDVDASVTFVGFDVNKFFVFVKNITERKRAESEILKLSRSVDQSPVSIIITDTNGNIEYANPKVCETSGYNLDELMGNSPRIFNSGEKSKGEYEHLWATISSGNEWFGEFHNKRKNGKLYWEQASISSIKNLKGEITHYVAVKEDITEKKKIVEDLIIAKEKSLQSDRLKSAFLANMSHEIRTPMNGILGFAELLKEPELSGEEQQEYIAIIEKSGARMLNIISEIVSISKIESGTMETFISDTNINGQTQYVYNILKLDAEKKNLNIILKNGLPDKESIIKTDNEKFIGILSNLVKNAIKYTDEGSIEFGYDLLETHGRESILQFYVKDTGIGIPKGRQGAIFERFIQADIEDKMARQGAGLGLAIARAFVEMLGGKIWLESEEGIGSTFYFSIPYNPKTEEKQDEANLNPDREDKIQLNISKVLIVEDDETSASLMKEIVSKFSKEIFFANNGLEAVNLCRKNPHLDLILMDIQMPVMNGYIATEQIRQFNKDVIIIAQTAFGLEGDREKTIQAGCNDYISKPIKLEELHDRIKKYFKKKI